MSQQSEITFFVDRSIGKAVPIALRNIGETVAAHDEHFSPEALDVEWLPEVSQRGWVVLTKDAKISSRPSEVEAIARAGARVFILASSKLTRQEMVEVFVNAVERLKRFTQGNQAPFIAKIYRNGRVQIWQNRDQLHKRLSKEQE